MEELYLDFTENQKISRGRKIFFVSLGFLLICEGTVVLIISDNSQHVLSSLISPILNIFLGALFILQAYSDKLFKGNSYFRVSDDAIEFKFNRFSKAVKIDWKNVDLIFNKPARFDFRLKSKETVSIKLTWVSMSKMNIIKSKIRKEAEMKQIEIK